MATTDHRGFVSVTRGILRECCSSSTVLADHCQIGTRVLCSMRPTSSRTVGQFGWTWATIWRFQITWGNGAVSAIWKVHGRCPRSSLGSPIEVLRRSRISNGQHVRCSFLRFVCLDSVMARNRTEHPIWFWSVISPLPSSSVVTVSSSSCGNHLREAWIPRLSIPWPKGSMENHALSPTWFRRSWSVLQLSLLDAKRFPSIYQTKSRGYQWTPTLPMIRLIGRT